MVEYLLQVPAEPDSWEMSPAQFPDHMVAAVEQISNLHRMITTCKHTSSSTVMPPIHSTSLHKTFYLQQKFTLNIGVKAVFVSYRMLCYNAHSHKLAVRRGAAAKQICNGLQEKGCCRSMCNVGWKVISFLQETHSLQQQQAKSCTLLRELL